ncbi:hypothetical protein CKY12_04620 [Photorhabdus sp. S12-55]|nr:hypothetical protein PluDJC_04595 [Photorhabdus laumondii subsp. laumondii]RAW87618.1 hypothetical protein CKY09_06170 [Photorhabdus sp. S5P8-50]RAW88299.1 hypothetical protein CKY12_04620 [Photorhabdus sp. S12-55]
MVKNDGYIYTAAYSYSDVTISLIPEANLFIPVIFQAASLLAALAHPSHIVCYAPRDSLPCRRDAS